MGPVFATGGTQIKSGESAATGGRQARAAPISVSSLRINTRGRRVAPIVIGVLRNGILPSKLQKTHHRACTRPVVRKDPPGDARLDGHNLGCKEGEK